MFLNASTVHEWNYILEMNEIEKNVNENSEMQTCEFQ